MNENVAINLDKFKLLFAETLKLPYELGFNLVYSPQGISFEISKGDSVNVTIPYSSVVSIHTHPQFLYDSFYKPPSHTDYIQSIYDAFKKNPVNIVVEENGMWIYYPNKDLIDEIIKIQPDISQILEGEMAEGEVKREINVGDRLYELIDVLDHNTNNEHQNLVLNKNLVLNLVLKKIGRTPSRHLLEHLEKRDINTLLKNYGINKRKITVEEYIDHLAHIASDDLGIGYEVRYIPWSDPFEFTINLNPERLLVFNEIKERGLNVFDDNDADIINLIAESTEDNRILRISRASFPSERK